MDPAINDVFMGYAPPRKEVKKHNTFPLDLDLIELEFFNSVECLQLINNNFPPIESESEEEIEEKEEKFEVELIIPEMEYAYQEMEIVEYEIMYGPETNMEILVPIVIQEGEKAAKKPSKKMPKRQQIMVSIPREQVDVQKENIPSGLLQEICSPDPLTEKWNQPLFTFTCLVSLCLFIQPDRRMGVSEMYAYLEEAFPYFKYTMKKWKNSLRHNLSHAKFFTRVIVDEEKKPNKWTFDLRFFKGVADEIRHHQVTKTKYLMHVISSPSVLQDLRKCGLVDSELVKKLVPAEQ